MLKRVLTGAFARLWRRPALTPAALLALRPRRILLVRQHNQMGDMVCATPCFRAVRETWPAAEIALVTAPVNQQVVAHNPHLDRLFLFEQRLWRRPFALGRFLGGLRRFDADLAIVLTSVSFSATSAFLALWSNARHVIGGDGRPYGSRISDAFSLQLPGSPELDRHAVDHSLAPLAAVGITTADRSTVVVPSPAQAAEAAALRAQLLPPGPYWALHPGAGKPQNVWPAERFAAVAAAVAAGGVPVLVLHGPADQAQLAAFRAALPVAAGSAPIAIAPATSVGTGAALMAGAERMLCNDTGVMHVAGAVGTPTLALFGPTDPALWKPPGDHVVALRADHRRDDPRGAEFGWLETLDAGRVLAAWRGLGTHDH
ncbi:MAG: glycosyltransferase family 9 protein [Candidatus Krumholzibacteriia bacterium]